MFLDCTQINIQKWAACFFYTIKHLRQTPQWGRKSEDIGFNARSPLLISETVMVTSLPEMEIPSLYTKSFLKLYKGQIHWYYVYNIPTRTLQFNNLGKINYVEEIKIKR